MKFLVIRPGAIGDTLLAFPVLRLLRTQVRDPHIMLVGNASVLPLAPAFGIAESVSDYEQVQWSELFSLEGIHDTVLREQLRRVDRAICWLRDVDGVVEANLRQAGVSEVVVAPGRPPEGTRMHVVEYLAQAIGLPRPPTNMTFRLPEVREAEASRSWVTVHPGSGGAHKCWPAHRFATLIEELLRRDYAVLLLAGPADEERVEDILHGIAPSAAQLEVLVNRPLLEVAQRLQGCRCYVGNDSGITHLAALLGVPTVAIFGPGDPVIWHPVGPYVKIVQSDPLERLEVDMVLEAIEWA